MKEIDPLRHHSLSLTNTLLQEVVATQSTAQKVPDCTLQLEMEMSIEFKSTEDTFYLLTSRSGGLSYPISVDMRW